MARVEIKVKPNARESSLVQQEDGTWVAPLKSAPVDGKANEELIGLVAAAFSVRRARVRIRTGATSRMKRVEIVDE
jgi:uncharacterized protein (TIGR00251 family)